MKKKRQKTSINYWERELLSLDWLSLPYLCYYDVGCSGQPESGSAGHNQSLGAQRTEYCEAGGDGGGGRSACTSRESWNYRFTPFSPGRASHCTTPLHSPFGQNFASHRCHFSHAGLTAALQAPFHNNLATREQTRTKKSERQFDERREVEVEVVQPERKILDVALPVLCWWWGARHFLSPLCCRFKILHHQKI